jgi:hypothetical protein
MDHYSVRHLCQPDESYEQLVHTLKRYTSQRALKLLKKYKGKMSKCTEKRLIDESAQERSREDILSGWDCLFKPPTNEPKIMVIGQNPYKMYFGCHSGKEFTTSDRKFLWLITCMIKNNNLEYKDWKNSYFKKINGDPDKFEKLFNGARMVNIDMFRYYFQRNDGTLDITSSINKVDNGVIWDYFKELRQVSHKIVQTLLSRKNLKFCIAASSEAREKIEQLIDEFPDKNSESKFNYFYTPHPRSCQSWKSIPEIIKKRSSL